MKKPKPPRQKQPHSAPPSQSPPQPKEPLVWQVFRTWWGKLTAGLAIIAIIENGFSAFDFFRTAYEDTKPEITLSAEDINPFVLPFRVTNNSHYLEMDNITWLCGLEKLNTPTLNLQGMSITTDTPPRNLAPRGDTTFRCPILADKLADKHISAIIRPIVNYDTLWFHRNYSERKFTWYPDATPPRWIASD